VLAGGQLCSAPVTFNRDIAPIIFRSCAPCHRPGESAPFPLLTFADVRRHAFEIVAATQTRYMPPWLPAPGYGDFTGERRLTQTELKLIADWVSQGRLEGNPADLPPAPHFTQGWQLGPPDMIIRMPVPYKIPAGGSDVFRNFVLPVNLNETKYIRAFELRPGNKRLVHHANLLVDRRGTLRRRDGEDGQPGFSGMEITAEARSDSFDPDSHFLFWKPGTVMQSEPDDMSWRLDPGSDLILNLHVQPSGKEETVQAMLGLYFASKPPTRVPTLIQLENDGKIDIPAGSRQFEIDDHLTLPVDVQVLAIYPHAHYLGKQIDAWAALPDGSRRPLIRIPDWDLNWQAVYTYCEPFWLPKGTTVFMRIQYDNSSSNPRNPAVPPIEVLAGPRSRDEMGHVWLQVLPRKKTDEDPRTTLEEALMRRRLEKYPGDFVANCNLGALAATKRDDSSAVLYFSEAVRVQPANATARNGLGAALLAQSRFDAAIVELKEALKIDPAHLNARWNLAHALVSRGDLDGAAAEMQLFVKQQPANADAQAGLGAIYFLEKRYNDALPYLEEAARLRPNDSDIRTNLGALFAARGQFREAIRAFEEALQSNPNDSVAQKYLAQARAALAAEQP
jgi:Flp pilus assembly protein TadD